MGDLIQLKWEQQGFPEQAESNLPGLFWEAVLAAEGGFPCLKSIRADTGRNVTLNLLIVGSTLHGPPNSTTCACWD
jgi:hypothetical protein